ncbi:MAG: hypothetical protein HN348_32540 [Proteobacteria bacterium]|nr:hypothetical protein [Pseudomonadota bacterium]
MARLLCEADMKVSVTCCCTDIKEVPMEEEINPRMAKALSRYEVIASSTPSCP